MKIKILLVLIVIGINVCAQTDTVNNGTGPGVGDGEILYTAFEKVNENIKEVNKISSVDTSITVDEAQSLIDEFGLIKFGNTLNDTFVFNKPLNITSNSIIVIDGYVKMANSVIRPLLADIAAGNTFLTISNPSQYYEVGQWINITDTLQQFVGGGAGHDRRMGYVSEITSISNDTIYFRDPCYMDVSVSDEGEIGTYNSNFIVEDAENVSFIGNGIIDNNKQNGFNHGAWNSTGMEEIRSGNCISIKTCNNIVLKGITLQYAKLHNITTWNTDYVKASNINLLACHDKNWLFYNTSYAQVVNSRADSADFEDGFMLYFGNSDIEISNCQSFGNGRLGIGVNSTNTNINISNCNATNNGANLYIGLSKSVSVNNFISVGGGLYRHNKANPKFPVQINASRDISISGLTIDGCDTTVNYLCYVNGDSYNINISDSYFKNSSLVSSGNGIGFGCAATDLVYPHDVNLTGVVFDTLKTAFAFDASGPENINFEKCIFTRNSAYGVVRTFTKFYNCGGISTYDSGTITITSAATFRYGSTLAGSSVYPDQEKFKCWFLDDGGNSTKIWCSWTSSSDYPGNNFRIDVDVAPGKDINIAWEYDHNLNTAP